MSRAAERWYTYFKIVVDDEEMNREERSDAER